MSKIFRVQDFNNRGMYSTENPSIKEAEIVKRHNSLRKI